MTPKRHFEFNWPLVELNCFLTRIRSNCEHNSGIIWQSSFFFGHIFEEIQQCRQNLEWKGSSPPNFSRICPTIWVLILVQQNFISWNMSSWILYKLPRPYCELLERSRKKIRKFFEDIIIDLNQEVWMNEKVAPDAATSRVDSRGAFFK